jgi:hypothetical protein
MRRRRATDACSFLNKEKRAICPRLVAHHAPLSPPLLARRGSFSLSPSHPSSSGGSPCCEGRPSTRRQATARTFLGGIGTGTPDTPVQVGHPGRTSPGWRKLEGDLVRTRSREPGDGRPGAKKGWTLPGHHSVWPWCLVVRTVTSSALRSSGGPPSRV